MRKSVNTQREHELARSATRLARFERRKLRRLAWARFWHRDESRPEPCSPGCPGWSTFDTARGVELQRCDECGVYADDDEAAAAAWAAFGALIAGRIGDDADGALCRLVDFLTERVQESPDIESEAMAESLRDCFQALALAVHQAAEG